MADYETQIRSQMNQLLTWEQYRDLLLNTLSAADYPGLEDQVRSEFSEQYIDNPKLMADWLVELFSPHELISNELRSMAALSGPTFLLDSLLIVNRTRNLVVNGTFDTDSDWGLTQSVISGGLATITSADGSYAAITQSQETTQEKSHLFSMEVVSITGTIALGIASTPLVAATTGVSGLPEGILRPPSDTFTLEIKRQGGAATAEVDNVKLRRLEA